MMQLEHKLFQHSTYFRNMTKIHNFMVLPLVSNVIPSAGSVRQCSSSAKVAAASRDLAVIRDPFIRSAHLTRPERLPLSAGSIYER